MTLKKLSEFDAPPDGKVWASTEKMDRLRAAYAKEIADPQPAITVDDIPNTYEAITKEWLTAVMGAEVPGAEIVSFQLGPADDGTSNRRGITMVWNEAGTKAGLAKSVFCKATQSLNNRLNLAWGGIDSEINFFRYIRPIVGIEAPVGLHARFDPVSYNSIVVLVDMSDTVDFLEYYSPVTHEMVEGQLALLAQMHGKYYRSQDPHLLNLISFSDFMTGYCATVSIEEACRNGWAAAESVIPPRLFARGGEVWEKTVASWQRNGRLPHTLCQSDSHLGNWYRTKEGKMGLQDYQTCGRGHWSREVGYVLATAPAIQDRRAWEKELVRGYLAALAKAGGPTVSEDEAWEEIKFQSLTVMAFWTLTLRPSSDMPANMQKPECTLSFMERIAAFMDDHNVLDVVEV